MKKFYFASFLFLVSATLGLIILVRHQNAVSSAVQKTSMLQQAANPAVTSTEPSTLQPSSTAANILPEKGQNNSGNIIFRF